jgi:hypothetical protein
LIAALEEVVVRFASRHCLKGEIRRGIETEFTENRQRLGITKRNKKGFEAQPMMVQMNALALDLIVWFRC